MTDRPHSHIRRAVKRGIDACCAVAVAPCVWSCRGRPGPAAPDPGFTFWAQALALVPGLPGVFLRRAFYRATLDRCGRSFFVGFGAIFSHRRVTIEEDVYVGPYAIVGASRLRRGCLVGSRVSIVSGTHLHTLDADGRWSPSDYSRLRTIDIGEGAWIGEGAIVMADVGGSALVAAGAVVSNQVLRGALVAGNPARFVRYLTEQVTPREVAGATL